MFFNYWFLTSWFPGLLASWLPGFSASWFLCLLGFFGFFVSPASWLLGFAVSRLFSLLVSRLLCFWAFWLLLLLGFLPGFLASPLTPPLAFLKPSTLTVNRSCHPCVCSRGSLCGSFCLQTGGRCAQKQKMQLSVFRQGYRDVLQAKQVCGSDSPSPPAILSRGKEHRFASCAPDKLPLERARSLVCSWPICS